MVGDLSDRPRVLLVDDSEDVRMLIRVRLEASQKFRVVAEAGDGRTGITLAGELRPDLVVLDLSMPGLDGLETLPLLRAAAPDTKVVVMSAHDAQDDLAQQALAAGADRYVQKGLRFDLTDVLAELSS